MAKYSKLTGDPKKGAVPPGEYNLLQALMAEWEALVGYQAEPNNADLLAMANYGVTTLADFSSLMFGETKYNALSKAMPWAKFGLDKEEYVSAGNIFRTTYREITGHDLSDADLAKAFNNPRNRTGGEQTTEYRSQLMNDAALQKQYGWIKYGMDFSQWTQQKLQLRSAFGRDINDTEAATILQYQKAASGSNLSAIARSASQQQPVMAGVGVGGSLTR